MTQYLPANLLALFAAREPIPYLPPVDLLSHEKKRQSYTGLAKFVHAFEPLSEAQPPKVIETKEERAERKRREKAELAAYRLEQDLALWNPKENPNATEDPYKTLFVSRIAFDTSESKLKREFGIYGRIRTIRLVHNVETGKPRGYAFIEYEKESDMHAAYKHADGKKIDGRRVVVDVERGRTVKGWRPRRLGGGLGGTRRGGNDQNNRYSGREDSRRMHGGPMAPGHPPHHGPPPPSYGGSSYRHYRGPADYNRDHRYHQGPQANNGMRRRSRSRSKDRYSRRYKERSYRSRTPRSRSRDRRRNRRDSSKSPYSRRRRHRRSGSGDDKKNVPNSGSRGNESDRSSSARSTGRRQHSPFDQAEVKAQG